MQRNIFILVHIVAFDNINLSFICKYYINVWICNVLIHYSIDGYLEYLQSFITIKKAAMNIP